MTRTANISANRSHNLTRSSYHILLAPKELDATAARSRDYLVKRETAVRLAALHYVASMHGSGTDGALTDIDTVLPGSFIEVRVLLRCEAKPMGRNQRVYRYVTFPANPSTFEFANISTVA